MKKWLKRLGYVAIGFGVLLVAAYFVLTSSWFITKVALPMVSKKLQTPVTAERVALSPFSSVQITGLNVGPADARLVAGLDMQCRYSLWKMAFSKKPFVKSLEITRGDITLKRGADGKLNVPPEFSAKAEAALAGKPVAVQVRGLTLKVTDLAPGLKATTDLGCQFQDCRFNNLTISSGDLKVHAEPTFDQAFQPSQATAAVKLDNLKATVNGKPLQPQQVALDANIGIAGQRYTINQLVASVSGGGKPEAKLEVKGTVDAATRDADLEVATTAESDILNLAGALAGDYEFNKTRVNCTIKVVSTKGQKVSIKADGEIRDLTLGSAKLGIKPVEPIQLGWKIDTAADLAGQVLERADIRLTGDTAGSRFCTLQMTSSGPVSLKGDATGGVDLDFSLIPAVANSFIPPAQGLAVSPAAAISGKLKLAASGQNAASVSGRINLAKFALTKPGSTVPLAEPVDGEVAVEMKAVLGADKAMSFTIDRFDATMKNAVQSLLALQVRGSGSVGPKEKKIDLTITGDGIDTGALLLLLPAKPVAAATPPPAAAPAKPVVPPADAPLFKPMAFKLPFPAAELEPVKALAGVSATIRLDLKNLRHQQILVSELALDTTVADSIATLKPSHVTVNGSRLDFSGRANLGVAGYDYEMAADAAGIALAPWIDSLAPAAKGAAGTLEKLHVAVKGHGVTQKSIQENLAADITVKLAGLTWPAFRNWGPQDLGLEIQVKPGKDALATTGTLALTSRLTDEKGKTVSPVSTRIAWDARLTPEKLALAACTIAVTAPDKSLADLKLDGDVVFATPKIGLKITGGSIRADQLMLLAPQSAKPVTTFTGTLPLFVGAAAAAQPIKLPLPEKEPAAINLGTLDADLAIDIREITYGEVTVANLKTAVTVKNSVVALTPSSVTVNGTPLEYQGTVKTNVAGFDYAVALKTTKELDLTPLGTTFAPDLGFGGSLAKADVSLAGRGITEKALSANLNGAVAVRLNHVVLKKKFANYQSIDLAVDLKLKPLQTAIGITGDIQAACQLTDALQKQAKMVKTIKLDAVVNTSSATLKQTQVVISETTAEPAKSLGNLGLTGSFEFAPQRFALAVTGGELDALRIQQLLPTPPAAIAAAAPAQPVEPAAVPAPAGAIVEKSYFPPKEIAPIDLGALNGKATVKLGKISYGKVFVDSTDLRINLADSVVMVESGSQITLNGSPITLEAEARLKDTPLAYKTRINMTKPLELQPFAAQFAPAFEKNFSGTLDVLKLDLSGRGITQPNVQKYLQLASDLRSNNLMIRDLNIGEMLFTPKKNGNLLRQAVDAIGKTTIDWLLSNPDLKVVSFDKIALPLSTRDGGIVIGQEAILQGPVIRIVPSGSIKLTPKLDLDLQTSLGYGGSVAKQLPGDVAHLFSSQITDTLPNGVKRVYQTMPEIIPIAGNATKPMIRMMDAIQEAGTRLLKDQLIPGVGGDSGGKPKNSKDALIGAGLDILSGGKGKKTEPAQPQPPATQPNTQPQPPAAKPAAKPAKPEDELINAGLGILGNALEKKKKKK